MENEQKFLKILEKFENKKARIFVGETNLFYFQKALG